MNASIFFNIGVVALSAAMMTCLPVSAQEATLPPLGNLSPQKEAHLTLNVQNCLMDAIVNITDKATNTTVFRKAIIKRDRHSFSLQWWGKEGEYQISIVPANAETRSLFQREMVREVTLKKGESSTLLVDFEENRPADMAPLPTEEQIDQFCQGETQALQDYLGSPNTVLLVYVYEQTLAPNPNERARRLYGLVQTRKAMVLQSTNPDIKAGERLQWSQARETGDKAEVYLERAKATPFKPTLMYIINPIKIEESKLHGETEFYIFPMEDRRHYHYLRASHIIQGIPA